MNGAPGVRLTFFNGIDRRFLSIIVASIELLKTISKIIFLNQILPRVLHTRCVCVCECVCVYCTLSRDEGRDCTSKLVPIYCTDINREQPPTHSWSNCLIFLSSSRTCLIFLPSSLENICYDWQIVRVCVCVVLQSLPFFGWFDFRSRVLYLFSRISFSRTVWMTIKFIFTQSVSLLVITFNDFVPFWKSLEVHLNCLHTHTHVPALKAINCR